MKDVTIKIKGTRYEEGEQEEQMEFVSEAKMYEKSGARYFLVDESIFSGFSDSKTTLKVMDNAIKVKRTGGEEDAFGMELEFSKGTRFLNKYYTPYGNFDVEVLTTDINTDLSPEGFGKITLGYDISLQGSDQGRNEIEIEILQ